ncbi:MAG: hypothetical protein MUP71_11780 [Candidatus Aminicenantes bacterium]|nr:hypothetical protein [Candidatus Aminicenantes bacterium]
MEKLFHTFYLICHETVAHSAVFDPYGGLQKQWVNTYSPSLKFSGKMG